MSRIRPCDPSRTGMMSASQAILRMVAAVTGPVKARVPVPVNPSGPAPGPVNPSVPAPAPVNRRGSVALVPPNVPVPSSTPPASVSRWRRSRRSR